MPTGSWKHDSIDEDPRASTNSISSASDRIVVSNLHYEVMPRDLVVCQVLS